MFRYQAFTNDSSRVVYAGKERSWLP